MAEVLCPECGTEVPRDEIRSSSGVDYPVYHLLPGSPPKKCPGSDKPVKATEKGSDR